MSALSKNGPINGALSKEVLLHYPTETEVEGESRATENQKVMYVL